MNNVKLSVIVPAYNEAKTIIQILERVNIQKRALRDVQLEIVVIDDCSRDSTRQLLNENPSLYDHLVLHEKNGGKGEAVRSGLKKATGEYILFQDADLEYDPEEYSKLILPLIRFNADVVIGSRLLAPQYIRVHYFWNKLGNRFITFFFNILFNKTFTDIYTCYFVFKKNLVPYQELKTSGWEQQAEILAKAIKKGVAFYEVPISYHGRTVAEGKKIKPIHAISVLWTIFKERISS